MPTTKKNRNVHRLASWSKMLQLSQVQVQPSNRRTPENARKFLITTLRILMKKAACFRGMFLHPPQWWRDFCTVCKSLTRVASVGYTTNESSRLRCCQECTLSFRAPIGIDHRKKRIEQGRRTVYGLPLFLLIQKL